MIQILVEKWKTFLKLWFSAVAVQILYYQHFSNEEKSQHLENSMKILHHIDHFQVNWCRVRRARVDFDSLLRPCFYNISWNGQSPNRQLQTDAAKSLISFFDISQRVSSVVLAFKQRLAMENWSLLAATRGVFCFAVQPRCRPILLITEMELTNFCF